MVYTIYIHLYSISWYDYTEFNKTNKAGTPFTIRISLLRTKYMVYTIYVYIQLYLMGFISLFFCWGKKTQYIIQEDDKWAIGGNNICSLPFIIYLYNIMIDIMMYHDWYHDV